MALLIVCAHAGSRRELGEAALALVCVQIAFGGGRALLGEVALVRDSLLGRLEATQMLRSAQVLGAGIGIAFVAAGLAFDSLSLLVLFAPFMPALLAQDAMRYVSFAQTRPALALRGDAVWLLGFGLIVSLVSWLGSPLAVEGAVIAWCVSASSSIAAMLPRLLLRSFSCSSRWIRDSRTIARAYLPEYVVTLMTTAIPALAVGVLGGVAEVGALRLAFGLLGPVAILVTALVNTLTPALVRDRRASLGVEIGLSGVATSAVVIWVVVALLLPDETGRWLAGPAWAEAATWALWLSLGYIALAAQSGAVVGLRVRDLADLSARVRIVLAPAALALPVIGYGAAHDAGYGVGFGLAAGLTAVALWGELVRSSRHRGVTA